jgi:hypothetical protein
MATQAYPAHAAAPGRIWWFAPVELGAMALQLAVLLYVAVLSSLLDLLSYVLGALLPISRINALVERASRAVAPKLLADERDWPILPVLASITVLVPASCVLQFIHPGMSWLVACVIHHAVLLGAGGQRFAKLFSIKHNEAHRPKGFFRGRAGLVFRRYVEGLAMVFYGNIFGLDCIHHVKIHHGEDGGPDDPQNTRGYDRTNSWHFLHFIGVRHLAVTLGIATPRYLLRGGRSRDARAFLIAVLIFYAGVAALLWYDWHIAIAVAIGPLLLSNVFAALASWLQHSFGSQDETADPIADTITLLSPTEFLNEGYHLAHHYRSSTHWTDLPQRFEEWCVRHPESNPIVLEGVNWVDLAVLLYVRRRVDLVAERWRPRLPEHANLTLERRTAFLRQRLGGELLRS